MTPYWLYFDLLKMRDKVWSAFAADAAARPTRATDGLIERLRVQLECVTDPNDWARNLYETQFWQGVLDRRGNQMIMTRWRREIMARDELEYEPRSSFGDEAEQLRKEVARVRAEKRRR